MSELQVKIIENNSFLSYSGYMKRWPYFLYMMLSNFIAKLATVITSLDFVSDIVGGVFALLIFAGTSILTFSYVTRRVRDIRKNISNLTVGVIVAVMFILQLVFAFASQDIGLVSICILAMIGFSILFLPANFLQKSDFNPDLRSEDLELKE